MDGILLDLIGVILQVLGLIAAFGSLTVGVASLTLQARLKDKIGRASCRERVSSPV